MRMLRLGILVMCALLAACTTAPEIKQALAAKDQAYGEHQRLMQQYRELVSNITARHEGYATLKDDGERDSFADHDVAIAGPIPTKISPGYSEPAGSSAMMKTIKACRSRTSCSGMSPISPTWPRSPRQSGSPSAPR